MRGGKRQRASSREFLQDRAAQRGTFHRIGTRAEFVHEHQGSRSSESQDLREVPQVRAERGEARFDALLVPDVGEDVIEDAELRSVPYRSGNAGLEHCRDQSHRLEQHSLSTRVRTGEEQRALSGFHRQVERHDTLDLREQQRVSAVPDDHCVAGTAHVSRNAVEPLGITGTGIQRIQFGQRVERFGQPLAQRPEFFRELCQDSLHLPGLLSLEVPNPVHELHGGRRLHEERGTARGGVMHDSSNVRACLTTNRDDIPAVSNRHAHVRHRLMRFQARHGSFQQPHQLALGTAKLPTQLAQHRRGVVLHAAVMVNRALHLLLQVTRDRQAGSQRAEHGGHDARAAFVAKLVVSAPRAQQQPGSVEQLPSVPRKALHTQGTERTAEVRYRFRSPATLARDQCANRRDTGVFPANPLEVRHGKQRAHPLGTHLAYRPFGDQVEDARILQYCQCVLIHFRTASRCEGVCTAMVGREVEGYRTARWLLACCQLLTDNRADDAAIRPSLELRHHGCHHGSDLRSTPLNCRPHCRADLIRVGLLRQIAFKDDHFCALPFRQLLAPALFIGFRRLPPALDAALKHFHHLFIGELAPQLDLPVLHIRHDGAEQKRTRLVLRLARGVQVVLKALE